MRQWSNIPQDLRDTPHWILWRAVPRPDGKSNKIPISAKTLQACDVTDPVSWSSFTECTAVHDKGQSTGLAFCFTDSDLYSGLDFDATLDPEFLKLQKQIVERLDSYTEFSQSGAGVHVIVKGKIPHAKRYKQIEIYSRDRFFVMTGNVWGEPKPIQDRQWHIEQLYVELMKLSGVPTDGTGPRVIDATFTYAQVIEDKEIFEIASNAVNGAKFLDLWNGKWQDLTDEHTGTRYPSHSEADQALINMLAFYTPNVEQIRRMYKASVLGNDPKDKFAHRWQRTDWVNYSIQLALDRTPPAFILEHVREQVRLLNAPSHVNGAEAVHLIEPLAPAENPYTFPPGLVGEIAQFILDRAPRQVPEIALATALGWMAGVCGRGWNINHIGLNLYIMVMGGTGIGKDITHLGMDLLAAAIKEGHEIITVKGSQIPFHPIVDQFIGPRHFASGQALTRHFSGPNASTSFVSVFGEFGHQLAAMSSERANQADLRLKGNLLEIHSKSGHGNVYKETAFAQKENNTQAVQSPALSILCEGTPETFFEAFNKRIILDGLLPRFVIFDYRGKRQYLNENMHNAPLDPGMINRARELVLTSNFYMQPDHKSVCDLQLTPEAFKRLKSYDIETTDLANEVKNAVMTELWNRAHINVMKLAGLVAIGMAIDHMQPIWVDINCVNWAICLINYNVRNMLERISSGDIQLDDPAAVNEQLQIGYMAHCIKEYMTLPLGKGYARLADPMFHRNHMITHSYLSTRVRRFNCYKKDRLPFDKCYDRAIKHLKDVSAIAEVHEMTAKNSLRLIEGPSIMEKRFPKMYRVVDAIALDVEVIVPSD